MPVVTFSFITRHWCGLAMALAGLVLLGCSPHHNWRLSRLPGVPLQALMPCKPDSAQREVPLWGPAQPPVPLHMMSCTVGQHTFAVASLPLAPQAAQAGPAATPAQAEEAWRQAGWASLRQPVPPLAEAPPGWVGVAQAVPGAQAGQRWQGPGLDHQGQPLQAQWLLAHNGHWLVQVALYGPPLADDVASTFFDGLRFD
jgi:hypothetical protein